jgi:hypothetical protein
MGLFHRAERNTRPASTAQWSAFAFGNTAALEEFTNSFGLSLTKDEQSQLVEKVRRHPGMLDTSHAGQVQIARLIEETVPQANLPLFIDTSKLEMIRMADGKMNLTVAWNGTSIPINKLRREVSEAKDGAVWVTFTAEGKQPVTLPLRTPSAGPKRSAATSELTKE